MASAYRDNDGQLRGSLSYEGGGTIRIVEHIIPVILPCTGCNALTFHLLGSEHAGLGLQIPFMGTIASTHKRYQLICNNCTVTSGVCGYNLLKELESRVLPASICTRLDRFLSICGKAPPGYSNGFLAFMCQLDPEYANEAAWISAYRRYDGR